MCRSNLIIFTIRESGLSKHLWRNIRFNPLPPILGGRIRNWGTPPNPWQDFALHPLGISDLELGDAFKGLCPSAHTLGRTLRAVALMCPYTRKGRGHA